MMELEYKSDFQLAADNWKKFWKNELGRPVLKITAPKDEARPVPYPKSYNYIDKSVNDWMDAVEDYFENNLFIAEAIPAYIISFAPDNFSSFLGADIQWNENSRGTNWVVPFVKDWDDKEIKFDPESRWWQKTLEVVSAFRKRFDGKAIVVPPHLQGGLDCLSAIRGVNELLMDIIDCPEKIKRALDQVSIAIKQVRNAYQEILDPDIGYVNRHLMYSDQMIDVPQCDFSCMISPAMFEEFQMPVLEKELEDLGPVDYHLDGPGAIQHLEDICALDKIKVIQWQPGAGEAAEKDWWDLYKKIDDLGKGIFFYGPNAIKNTKRACQELKTKQIFADIICLSEKQANQLLNKFTD